MIYRKRSLCASIGAFLAGAVYAQVSLDGTLGPAGALPGPDYQIGADLGRQVGGNLFHSFDQFSIHTGESATFSGPNSVTNIIGRVTGGNESFIDGALRSTIPGANLYLLNPAGVLFGEHARLDVPGSVHVSTADYLRLSDGGRFDVRTPANSVLTVAPVAAFGFLGGTPGRITVEGAFLQVPDGQTLSLIGGDITLTNATLYAPAGRINVAAVASAGEVIPTDTGLTLQGFDALGTFTLNHTTAERLKVDRGGSLGEEPLADLDTSGAGGGAIFIRGGQWFSRGGWVLSSTYGKQNGRGMDVAFAGEVRFENGTFVGTTTASSGAAGSILFDIGRLTLTGGSRILAATLGDGQGGTITVNAREAVTIAGTNAQGVSSGLFAIATAYEGSKGDAGAIRLTTPLLVLEDKAQIQTGTLGDGDAGDIEIQVERLNLSGGSIILSNTVGAGQGGTITVNASEAVTITGTKGRSSSLSVSSSNLTTANTGNAGNIILTTPNLILDGGFIIAASKFTTGGNIWINADHLKLLNGSQITSTALGDVPGSNGGNVTLNSTNIVALNGSKITAKAKKGKGGNILVNAEVFLHDAASVSDVLNASSEVIGNDGTVQNNAPTTDISGSLTALPARYLNAADQLSHRCGTGDRDTRSSFTVQGRGALPPGPDAPATTSATGCAPLALASAAPPSVMTDTPATTMLGFGDR